MSPQPPVGVITIWFGPGAQVESFAERLREVNYECVRPVFIIHRQERGEVARLRRAVPCATILEPGRNLGPGAGWNLGLQAVRNQDLRYVWFWNVDLTPAPDCLAQLVESLESNPRIGACQPLLLHADEPHTVQMFGGSVDLGSGTTAHDFGGATDLEVLSAERDAGYLDGGSTLVRSSVLRDLGGFDESFFLYYEDVDLSVRIRAAGLRTVAVRDARAWHHHRQIFRAGAMPYQVFYKTRNRLNFVAKHAGPAHKRILAGRLLAKLPLTAGYMLSTGEPGLVRAYVAGLAAGLAGRTGYAGWVR